MLCAQQYSFFLSVSTALFSTCGMSVWIFLVSAVLSLPNQLATVVFGWALSQSGGCECQCLGVFGDCFSLLMPVAAHNSTSKAVQWIIVAVTAVVTIVAMRYLRMRQAAVLPEVVLERQKRRQEQLQLPPFLPYGV
jgi:hypothetical protein